MRLRAGYQYTWEGREGISAGISPRIILSHIPCKTSYNGMSTLLIHRHLITHQIYMDIFLHRRGLSHGMGYTEQRGGVIPCCAHYWQSPYRDTVLLWKATTANNSNPGTWDGTHATNQTHMYRVHVAVPSMEDNAYLYKCTVVTWCKAHLCMECASYISWTSCNGTRDSTFSSVSFLVISYCARRKWSSHHFSCNNGIVM